MDKPGAVQGTSGAWAPMRTCDLPDIMAVETKAYEFPWTQGNFIDSIAAGYETRVHRDSVGGLVAYWVALMGVEEMHLLNLTVAPQQQRRGHGRRLLQELTEHAEGKGAQMLWLEVRQSNAPALALYRQFGFAPVGLRRAYYPAAAGLREDAIVMNFRLPQAE